MKRLRDRIREHLFPPVQPRRDWDQVRETGGREARERAERDLARIKSETPHYVELGAETKRIRIENHIGPDILTALMPKGRGTA